MKFFLAVIFIFSSASMNATVNIDLDPSDIIRIAKSSKLAGKCELLTTMVEFKNGPEAPPHAMEFIHNIYLIEASRSGVELNDFLSNCVTTVKEYVEFMDKLKTVDDFLKLEKK